MVINLAAQAGVRYSIENPSAYIQANIVGFSNIIEESKNYGVDTLFMLVVVLYMVGIRNYPLVRQIK